MNLESNRQKNSLYQNEKVYRSYLNTNVSENSGITVETSRAISSEISSQMSKKFGEIRIISVKYVPRRTLSQIDCIQKMSATQLGTLETISQG